MSEQHDDGRALRTMVDALREEPVPELPWEAMERRLMAQIAPREARARPSRGMSRAFGFAAIAAGLVLGIRLSGTAPKALAPASETLRRIEDSTIPLAAGEAGLSGARDLGALEPGDVIEAQEAPIQFAQTDVILWTLDPGGRLVVRRAKGSSPRDFGHVVSLERGSIRADVTPRDPSEGLVEPFAVEAGGTRVAVHGTAFRVTRMADEIIVDVEHGTVAIGPVGHTGLTLGRVMVGPARAAFSLDGGRAARFVMAGAASSKKGSAAAGASLDAVAGSLSEPPALAPIQASLAQSAAAPTLSATPAAPNPDTPSMDLSAPHNAGAKPPPESRALSALRMPIPLTEAGVRAVLASCFTRATSGSPSVRLSIRSTFTLKVHADGSIQSARFDPPLKPEFQACVAERIAGRVERGPGVVTLPIAFGP